jgi:hypothetical protein
MNRPLLGTLALALLCAIPACSDSGAPGSTATESDAFNTLPLGYADVQSTFGGEGDDGTTEWAPRGHGGPNADGPGRLVFGGLTRFFKFSFLLKPFRTEASDHCEFDTGSGRVVCEPLTRGGLTVNRSAAFSDAQGGVQQTFDLGTTNSVNVQLDVAGTRERQDGNQSTIDHHSDYSVTGLAAGSSDLTVAGESAGQEITTGSDDVGDFTAERKIGDKVEDLVVPKGRGRPFPTSGTITRTVEATITYSGQAPKARSRREVITFTGSSSATVEITRDGVTRTCTITATDGLDCP